MARGSTAIANSLGASQLAQAERSGPCEAARAQPAAGFGHEVLAHAAAFDRAQHLLTERLSGALLAMEPEPERREPRDVGPDRAAPVAARRALRMGGVERAHAAARCEPAVQDHGPGHRQLLVREGGGEQ